MQSVVNNIKKEEKTSQSKLSFQIINDLKESFPLQPYDIQMKIAQQIYLALQEQKLKFMIVQSPTGTGKSFSLLVPILKWISQSRYKLKLKAKSLQIGQNTKIKIPAFLFKKQNSEISEIKTNNLKKQRSNNLSQILDIQEIGKCRKLNKSSNPKDKEEVNVKNNSIFESLDVDEVQNQNNKTQNNTKRNLSKQQTFMQRQLNLQKQDIAVKLIFVSRTHTQLEQIIKAAQIIKNKLNQVKQCQEILTLTLGSKDLLCCNPNIKNTNKDNPQSISQKCQFLLNNSSCPYSHNYKIKQFYGKCLQDIKKMGEDYKICGYYGLKNSIDCADVLFVPYSSLVNGQIRKKIGININNSIIVFDQGHNLLDFIKSSSSPEISYCEVQALMLKISSYIEKYGQKLKVQNKSILLHFNFILKSILDSMKKIFEQKQSYCKHIIRLKNGESYVKLSILQLILSLNITEIKLHKIQVLFTLLDYDKKITFFEPESLKVKTNNKINSGTLSVSHIHNIIGWIEGLYKQNQDQIIVFIKNNNEFNQNDQKDISIKLFCLYSKQLEKIIQQSRLTIVAGGTMEPLSDFQQIFKKVTKQKYSILKVGHIIKPQQCKIKCIKRFLNKQVRFNHQNLHFSQESVKFLTQVIAQTLKKTINQAQNGQGIIAFIQSYKLLAIIKEGLKHLDFYSSILFDSQNSQSSKKQENILQLHTNQVNKKEKSILVSVMGGKLSEGINFTDDLARKLIIFGLPYPNIKAPQIVEQMKFYDNLNLQSFNGKLYYESLCLKTINQTIGRAIRHKNDWADIYLIDYRFDSLKNRLSQWMRDSIRICQDLEDL